MRYCDMSEMEIEERDEALAEVVDPMYMMRGEADADGEVEMDTSIPNGGDTAMEEV